MWWYTIGRLLHYLFRYRLRLNNPVFRIGSTFIAKKKIAAYHSFYFLQFLRLSASQSTFIAFAALLLHRILTSIVSRMCFCHALEKHVRCNLNYFLKILEMSPSLVQSLFRDSVNLFSLVCMYHGDIWPVFVIFMQRYYNFHNLSSPFNYNFSQISSMFHL